MTPIVVSQLAVDIVFPKIAAHLARAIDHHRCSEWTLDTVYSELVAGRMLLFVDNMMDPKNCLVARFATWGGERVFYVAFMGGEGGEDWAEVFKHIRAFANRYGVSRMTANLREGWLKYLKVKKLAILCEIEE